MKPYGRSQSTKTRRCAVVVVAAVASLAAGQGFHERWENATLGRWPPIESDTPVDEAFILGDEGWWNLNDSIAGEPGCGPTPNWGEIFMYEGSKALRLFSGFTDSYCSDNVWVALREFGSGYNTGFAIPISQDTMISFDEAGGLFGASCDFNLAFPPWFDNVSLKLVDNRDNLLIYVLQRHPDAESDTDALYYNLYFTEILLNRDGGTFTRNLYDDFSIISNFDPVGAEVVHIEFTIDEHGWAVLDNLCIEDSGWAPLDIEWIAMTSAKDFIDGVPDGATPWFFEIWVRFVNWGPLHHIDLTKPSESVPFGTIYYDGDDSWDYDSPVEYASLAELQADYPPGTYTLEFRDASNVLLRRVDLDYSGLPAEPAEPVNFTFPSTDGQTGVSLNPTLTWTVNSGAGDALMIEVEDDTYNIDVLVEAPVSMQTTSWPVDSLLGGHDHEAAVSVCRAKDWVGPDWPTMTVGTDSFSYSLMIEYLNVITFRTADQAAVYRFWSPANSRHFYTISEDEKEYVRVLYPAQTWTYETVAYCAFADSGEPGLAPVYRFWSNALSAHFYTISEDERDYVIAHLPTWTYEGPVFYAYPEGSQPVDASPVYRFWSDTLSTHFYTISEMEKQYVIDNLPAWEYETIAWYAYE